MAESCDFAGFERTEIGGTPSRWPFNGGDSESEPLEEPRSSSEYAEDPSFELSSEYRCGLVTEWFLEGRCCRRWCGGGGSGEWAEKE